MRLQYHQATFDLLTQTPIDSARFISAYDANYPPEHQLAWTKLDLYQRPIRFSQANVEHLNIFEKQFNITLPASVREWYSLDIVPEIMSVRGTEWVTLWEMQPDKNQSCYFLYDEYIDQAGDALRFKLDMGDDPPVIVQHQEEIVIEPTFSQFLFCHFWDWLANYNFEFTFTIPYHPYLPRGIDSLTASHIPLDHFRQHFQEITSRQHIRFYDEHRRMWVYPLIETNDKSQPVMSHKIVGGIFRADSLQHLQELAEIIWGNTLPVFHIETTEQPEVEAWLSDLREQQIKRALSNSKEWWTIKDVAKALAIPTSAAYSSILEQMQISTGNDVLESHVDNTDFSYDNRYRLRN